MSKPLSFLSTAIGADRPLFYVVVCARADDNADLLDNSRSGSSDDRDGRRGSAFDDDEVHEMALDALEAVWQDLWASPEGTHRGSEVVVSVCLPDGTLLGDMSK